VLGCGKASGDTTQFGLGQFTAVLTVVAGGGSSHGSIGHLSHVLYSNAAVFKRDRFPRGFVRRAAAPAEDAIEFSISQFAVVAGGGHHHTAPFVRSAQVGSAGIARDTVSSPPDENGNYSARNVREFILGQFSRWLTYWLAYLLARGSDFDCGGHRTGSFRSAQIRSACSSL
jgi:hypothetical protein